VPLRHALLYLVNLSFSLQLVLSGFSFDIQIGIFCDENDRVCLKPRYVVIPSSSKEARMCKVQVIQILDAQLEGEHT
jgi:hypothetical protein